MRILFDTNVILDVLLHRDPLFAESARLMTRVESRQLVGVVGATTCTTIHYLLSRHSSAEVTMKGVAYLLGLFEVAPVGRIVLEQALRLEFQDFEDAVLHEAARHVDADGIVTRNTKDFGRASLAVYTPAELLQLL